MKRLILPVLFLVVLLFVSVIYSDENVVTWKQGKELARKWLIKNADKTIKLSLYVPDRKNGFHSIRQYWNKYFFLKYKGYKIGLTVHPQLRKPFSFKKFKENFTSVSFDDIPAFKLNKWKVTLRTPLSSYSYEKVKVLPSNKKGYVKLFFKGDFFSIFGRKQTKECLNVPLDVGLPRKCYFSIRKNMKFQILIHAPVVLRD